MGLASIAALVAILVLALVLAANAGPASASTNSTTTELSPEQETPTPTDEACPGGGYNPTPTAIEVGAVPIVVESTTEEYFVLYVRHDLNGTVLELPVSVTLGENGTSTLAENVEALPKERYLVEKFLISDPADVDGDCIDDITELGDPTGMNPVNPAAAIALSDGAVTLPDRDTVRTLSYYELYLKFILFDLDTDRPGIYFMNTTAHESHRDFLDAIGLQRSQDMITGVMLYNEGLVAPDGSLGLYSYQLLPSYYPFSLVERSYTVLAASMPLLSDNLAFSARNHMLPSLRSDLPLYNESRIPLVFDIDIFPDTGFLALNPGEGYGLLRSMGPDDRANPRDVVIYEALPNDLPRVAGIVSTVPQTPLSHVNLRAVQDGVPNAYIRDALDEDSIDDLIGSYVHYNVTEDGWEMRAATRAEVDAHHAASRPAHEQTPQRDLSITSITPLSEIGFGNWTAFGVKAANVAVLGTLGFPNGTVPDGFAVPFYFYDEFMKHNGLYANITTMLADPDFQANYTVQELELKVLRKAIKDAETPGWISTALEEMHGEFPNGTSLRYRSSTNNEDLPGFNGAGLYDSKTQHPEETEEDGISKSLKQVYASLWNFRAFTERDFHRINHTAAAMGVLVHPNYSGELANGVAVSFDPIYDGDGSYYVNTQLGEDLVTNPEAHSVPEEILLHRDDSYRYTVLGTSNQVPPGQLLMSDDQLAQLGRHLTVIHEEFKKLYNPGSDDLFAMEIEFKITNDNILAIKQARPWVFSTAAADTTAPTVTSIVRSDPTDETTSAQTLVFAVTFSEDVTGVDLSDFALSSGGTGTGSVTNLAGSGDAYLVNVSAAQDGTYNLDLVSSGHGIADAADNPLSSPTPTGADHTYAVDTTAPAVTSIARSNPAEATTSERTLVFAVTFSKDVTGVDLSDFALSPDSTGGGSGSGQFTQARSPALAITEDNTVSDTITVPDSGTAMSVSVAIDISHTWIGDLKVDLVAPDGTTQTLHDRSGGDADDIDQTYAPDFAGVPIAGAWTLRINDNYAAADDGTLDSWTLTIDHGGADSPVTTVSGSGDTYHVTVSAAQDGTYNLDLVSSGHGIADAADNPLSSPTPTGADHTYTVSTAVADAVDPVITVSGDAFVTTWQTTSANETITISVGSATGNYTVAWGDGSVTMHVDDATHTYALAGNHTVSISGDFTKIYLADDSDNAAKLVSIDQWGDVRWKSMQGAFSDALNMIYRATDAPDLSQVSSMKRMFAYASAFDGDISGWDVSGVLVTDHMFRDATSFDGDISGWDVSSAIDMIGMFRGATKFNGNLSAWDVSKVVLMSDMFHGATKFNGNLSAWDVSGVTNMDSMFRGATKFNGNLSAWDVSGVELMFYMFRDATQFNGDIFRWDVSSVTTMEDMFNGAINFNQSISGWDVSSVTTMEDMFNGAINFNQNISGWDVSSVTDMDGMFNGAAAFRQNLGNWYVVLDNTGIDAGDAPGIVGNISAQNPALANQNATYGIEGGSDSFSIVDGSGLNMTVTPDKSHYIVNITSTGSFGTSNHRVYSVTVADIDTTIPTVSSIERHDPAVENTDSQTLVYRVTFSENVTGVDAADFALSPASTGGTSTGSGQFTQTRSPALAITLANTVSDTMTVTGSGTATSVSVSVDVSHTYIGDLKIDLIAPDGTTKTLHSQSFDSTDDIDQTYEPDFDGVSIAGAWTLRINDNYAAADDGTLNSWTLTIDHGSTASPATTVSGSGATYEVTVSAPTDGTYNLDLAPGHGIADEAGTPLADTAPTGADHTYTVSTIPADTTSPTVTSIERHDPAGQNTTSQTLVYRVTFSENVTGVDAADFALSSGSTGGGTSTSGQFNQTRSPALAITLANTVSDTITVPDSGTATSVSVSVDVSHTYIGDLKIDLIAPDGTTRTLHNYSGIDADDIDQTYEPDFDGVPIAGAWTLRINDNYAAADDGTLDSWTLTIDHGSTASPATTVSGSGAAYEVTVSAAQDGTYNLDLVSSGHGIADAANNPLSSPTPTGADHTYTVGTIPADTTAPAVTSIVRSDPAEATTSERTLVFAVTFSEDVTGVDAGDFALSSGGTGTGSVTNLAGSGDAYLVNVSAAQDGTYNLDLVSSGHGITDDANNPLSSPTPTGADHTYAVDTTAPAVTSIARSNPAEATTSERTLVFAVTFSEDVTGVDLSDFALSPDSTGGGSGSGQFTQARSPALAITEDNTVSDTITVPDSGTATSVSVAIDISHTWIGDLKVDLVAPDGTTQTLHDRSGGDADDIDQTYAPDFAGVPIAGAWTLRINDNYAAADDGTLDSWMLTINYGSSSTASPVTTVSGSGDTYHVTVSAAQDGTYNLDLVSSGHGITDAASNPLSSPTPTGADHTYTVSAVPADTTAPTVTSIVRSNPAEATTSERTLVFAVTFSEDVTGVDAGDFALSPDSTGGGSGSGQFTQTRSPALAITLANTVSDTMTVTGSGTATSVSVSVDVSHTYIGDLKIDLIAPDGTTKTLHSQSFDSTDDIDQTYEPDFDGVSIAGAWTLRINDNYAAADDGTLNSWTLTIDHGSTASPATTVSGSGATYEVTVSAPTDGTYNLDLAPGHGIADEAGTPLADTAPTGADQTYTVSTIPADTTSPTVTSIERHDPAGQNTTSQTLVYRVTFSENVTGVDAADFALSSGSTGGGTSTSGQFNQTRSPALAITLANTVSDTITVPDSGTATSVSVAIDISHTWIGDLKVDLVAPDGTTQTLHDRSGGDADDIDQTYAPDFGSVSIAGTWTLRINDNYAAEDDGTLNSWTLTIDHGSTAGPATTLSGSGSQYLVTVSATQDGTYNLDLSPEHGIADTASNPLADTAPTGADHTYTVSTVLADTTSPAVSSIERHDPAVENTDSQTLVYRVTFSENVTGVDAADFALSPASTGRTSTGSGQFTQTRSPALAITLANTVSDTMTVTGSGTATSVSVSVDVSHTYIGDLKIDLIAPDGTTKTLHSQSFDSTDDIDQTYEPDFDGVSIAGAWTLRINDNYAAADDGTLNSWTLTIDHGSTAGPATTVSGSGATYEVTVSAPTDGTYNLDLAPGHGIADEAGTPLADTAPTGADQTYTVSTN